MRIERSVSAYEEMGGVIPTWHTPEMNKDMAVYMRFTGSHGLVYPSTAPTSEAIGKTISKNELADVCDAVQPAIQGIDALIRGYRGYSDDQVTHHRVNYRVGTDRGAGVVPMSVAKLCSALGLPRILMPSSSVHFDAEAAPDDEASDMVILSHGGNPTWVYEGPVLHPYFEISEQTGMPSLLLKVLANQLIMPKFAALTAPNIVQMPQDAAILINDRTLHKQAMQFHKPEEPSVFLQSIIDVDLGEAEQE